MKKLTTFGAALILSIGAITFVKAQTAPITPAVVALAPPPPEVTPSPAPQTALAPEQPGKIIFFRPRRTLGAFYTYHVVTVGEDGSSVADSPRVCSLPNGRYCVYAAAPGVYYFNIRGPMSLTLNQDRIRVEIEPGQTYYVGQAVRMGVLDGSFQLVPATQEEFDKSKPREWKANK